MYYTYVLYNDKNDKIYIGHTSELEQRLLTHNKQAPAKSKSYTYKNKGKGEWKLVYKEEYKTRKKAIK